MSSSEVQTPPRSPQVFGDLSNSQQGNQRSDSKVEMPSSESIMESPLKMDPNSSRSYEEIRDIIDPVLFAKICEAVHHDKSSNSLEDEVEEVVDEVLSQFFPKEYVHYKAQGQTGWGTVQSTERRGAMRFYYLTVDGNKLPNKLDGSHIRRKFTPSEKEVRILLENITEKEFGKPWVIKQDLRDQFGIKDKFASIFCNPKAKKSLPTTTGRAEETTVVSSSEDENPSHVRRLSGIPPTKASKKKVEKVPKKMGRLKKEKEEKESKEEDEKKEKKTRKPREKASGGMEKFMKKEGGEPGDNPFTSPQKRGEKRLNSVVTKLNDSWRKRDYPEFLKSANWAAKVLSGVQIDSLSNECFRLAVRRVFDAEKDKQHLKKLGNREKKKEYRQNVINARKAGYKAVDNKIKAHFSGKEVVEDLTLDDNDLSCPGRPLTMSDSRMPLFSDSLMITQFISSLRQFIDVEEMITAEALCNGLHDGRVGYYKATVKVVIPLMKTLLQDVEYKLHTHFDARLHEFTIHDTNVSELCRALLIGKTKKDKRPKISGQNQPVDSDSEEEEGDEKEKGSVKNESAKDEEIKGENEEVEENILETSQEGQEEKAEVERMLSKLTPDREIWQLSPNIQMDLLKILLFKILELESCRDFMTEDISSEDAKNLSSRTKKLQSQLEEWRDGLSKLPEIDDNVDESSLSRDQTRRRAEAARKRDTLEKKIEDNQDKLEELFDKLATEKLIQQQCKRLSCIGEDRHCRRYYWVPHKTPDAGIWIQDFGKTRFEKYVKKCIADGETLEEYYSPVSKTEEKKVRKYCKGEHILESENWYRIEDIGVLNHFVNDLKNGTRERELKKFMAQNLELIVRAIRHKSQEKSKSETPEANGKEHNNEEEEGNNPSENPLDALKANFLELYTDLRDGYLTTLDPATFEPKIVSCESLDDLKELIKQLVDTVSESNVTVKLDYKDAKASGCYSWFQLAKWKARLFMAQNASAIHLLLSYFESRIDWKNSVREKRCSVCNSKRSPEAKMSCSDCGLVCHYYCVRPRLQEKSSSWSCTTCNRQNVLQARAAKAKPKYVVSDTEDDEEEDEEEEEEENEEVETKVEKQEKEEGEEEDETMDSDIFAADCDEEGPQAKRRLAKKRAIVDSDGENEEEAAKGRSSRSAAKKTKTSAANEEILNTWDEIKGANRMYRALQTIPAPRKSRRSAPAVTLESIENGLLYYKSFESFVEDLRTFFETARAYFENHNERKLDELEELIIALNLPESS